MNVSDLQSLLQQPLGVMVLTFAFFGFLYAVKALVTFFQNHILPRMYEEYLRQKEVVIPFAEKVLDKDWKQAAYFRDGDPKLVDFREKAIFVRPEVVSVEEELKKSRFVYLQGQPSSGKTVIALTFAYRRIESRKRVVYFPRPSAVSDTFFAYLESAAAVRFLDRERNALILDDVHLDVLRAARLFSLIFQRYSKLQLIYVSRHLLVEQLQDIEESTQFSFARFMPEIDVNADSAVAPLADFYCRRRFNRPLPPAVLSFFRHECGSDLLLLGRYLREWNGSSTVKLEDIRARVREAVRMDLERLRAYSADAVKILLVLGLFYRFEVSVERSFLEKILSFDVEGLLKRGEIRTDNGFLRVHHSSQAKLYSNAIESLGMPEFAELAGEFTPFPARLFQRYIEFRPRNLCETITSLSDSQLLERILEGEEIKEAVRFGLAHEKNLNLLGWAIFAMFKWHKGLAWEIMENADLSAAGDAAFASADAKEVSLFIHNLALVSQTKATHWIESIPAERLATKLTELPLRLLALNIGRIHRLSDTAYFEKFGNALDRQAVLEKLVREDDIAELRASLPHLCHALSGVFCVRSTSDADFVGEWTTKVSFYFGCDRAVRFISGRNIEVPYGASVRHLSARWMWLRENQRPDCSIVVDAGAAKALRDRRRSLFPAGVVAAEGPFERGDIVPVRDEHGEILGIGISNFSRQQLETVKGLRTSEIAAKTEVTPNRVYDNDQLVRQRNIQRLGEVARIASSP